MCGITGAWVHDGAATDSRYRKHVQAILNAQVARGPEHQEITDIKIAETQQLILGHNRLKIIDLSDNANQPLWDASKRYCITYNGEIYNYLELRALLTSLGYRFQTHSDTEVILNAFAHWGIDCITQFNGAFAFALYDAEEKRFWLVRDRFGKKPLFYYRTPKAYYFASSALALAKIFNLAPNLSYMTRGLHYWVYEDDSAIAPYLGLQALPAAHYLRLDYNATGEPRSHLQRYYDLSIQVEKQQAHMADQPFATLKDAVGAVLENAVVIRLRADVPLAVSLSGGFDSASIAALVKAHHSNIQCFTFGDAQDARSEGPLVAQLAKSHNLTVTYIPSDPNKLARAMAETIKAQGAPFPSLSIIAQYLVYQRVRESNVKVLLGGQGGDEAFMGYRKFHWFWLKELLTQQRYHHAIAFLWQSQRLLFAEGQRLHAFWRARHRYFAKGQRPELHVLNLPVIEPLALGDISSTTGTLHRQILDVTRFSLPTLLRYEDRNSMAHSVESRLPFLDYRLVELGLALPVALKLHKGYGKWVLRELMQAKIPDSIRLARYKRGFDVAANVQAQAIFAKALREGLHNTWDSIRDYVQSNIIIDKAFSDAALRQRPGALAEGISLLWLNAHQQGAKYE
jgi:asparagine synthase (glutamine-hydrolysing)